MCGKIPYIVQLRDVHVFFHFRSVFLLEKKWFRRERKCFFLKLQKLEKYRMKTERKWNFWKRILQNDLFYGKIIAIIQELGRSGV